MEFKKLKPSLIVLFLLIFLVPAFADLETNDSTSMQGLDATDLIAIGVSLLALFLGIISLVGYKRDGRTKLLLITAAFFIFALKGILIITSDLLSLEKPTLDIIANSLDFIVLLCIFLGIIKK